MWVRNLKAGTAMGLCLTFVPLAVTGQEEAGEVEAGLFVAPVETCLVAQTTSDCAPFREQILACAEDITLRECGPLLRDPEAVLADPDLSARAMAALQEVAGVLAESEEVPLAPVEGEVSEEAEVVPGPESGDPEAVEEMATSDVGEETSEDMLEAGDAGAELGVDPEADAMADEAGEPEAEPEPEPEPVEEPVAEELPEEPVEEPVVEETPEGAADEPAVEELPEEAMQEPAVEDLPEEVIGEPAVEEPPEEVMEEPVVEEPVQDAAPTGETGADATEAEAGTVAPEGTADGAEAVVTDDLADAVSDALGDAAEEMTGGEAPVVIEEELSAEVPLAPTEEVREIAPEDAAAIEELMAAPEVSAAVETLEEARAAEGGVPVAAQAGLDAAAEAAPDAVIEAEVAESGARASNEAFGSDFSLDFDGLRDGVTLEQAGLAALAGLVVGMAIDGDRVVARSDERVVVQDDAGGYDIWRDDDAVLAQQGAQRRIEQYADGSTLTRWTLPDGAQVITVRDATGRVLLRERVLADGTRVTLIDDLRAVEPVDVAALPRPVAREVVVGEETDPAAVLAILREAEAEARALDRGFSLRQVREVREVRELVPVLSGEPIIFESDRAEVRPEEARKLAQLGVLMEMLVAENRGEVFLIEGHTDATGPAAYNLGLSDRRAESVALALIELFDIPPENLVIQGFGEQHLRVPTLEAEARNRRVTVRRITPLLATGG